MIKFDRSIEVQEVFQETFLNESIIPSSSSTVKYVESDFVDYLENLKERCSSLKEKKDYCSIFSLITLAPKTWTIPTTADFFSVSECLVRRARIWKNEKGVMAIPKKHKGRPLSEDELPKLPKK